MRNGLAIDGAAGHPVLLGGATMLDGNGRVDGGPTRVLIADDHPLMRTGLRRLLEASGDEVVAEAGDGETAVRLALAIEPDVAFVDIVMPVMGGLEAARQISRGCPRTHVVVMSGYADPDGRAAATRLGAAAFIEKGARVEAIRAVLDGLRRGRSSGPAPAAQVDELRDLTPREREVLRLVSAGYSNLSIAVRLQISARTVEKHREHVMAKLDVHSVAGLTRFAIERSLA